MRVEVHLTKTLCKVILKFLPKIETSLTNTVETGFLVRFLFSTTTDIPCKLEKSKNILLNNFKTHAVMNDPRVLPPHKRSIVPFSPFST